MVKHIAEKRNPHVIVIVGQKIYPFDNLRYQTELDTFKSHPNIKVVGTVEGSYDPDKLRRPAKPIPTRASTT